MFTGTPLTGFSTWIYKVLFPLLWFGISVPVLLYGESKPSAHLDPGTSKALGWFFFMGFGAIATWMAWRLKTVSLLYDHLEIGGMFEQVRVPLREVTEVQVLRWYALGGGNPVRLSFEQPSAFLRGMLFLPESNERLEVLQTAWRRVRSVAAPTRSDEELARLADSVKRRPRSRA